MAYKHILVAIDLTEESEKVLQVAADTAELNEARITIVHVTENPVSAFSEWSDTPMVMTDAQVREKLFLQLSALVESVGLCKSLITIDFGRPADIIVKKAEQENPDLIILGSHGHHGVKLLLGSTANGVLHHANCDVLSVRIRQVIEQDT